MSRGFQIIIKSGTDYPDWDYTVEANTRQEAIDEIYHTLREAYTKAWIDKRLHEEKN